MICTRKKENHFTLLCE